MWKVVSSLFLCGLASSVAQADEKVQRVVPPPHVVTGLRKVLVLQHGGSLDQQLQEATAQGVRTRLGWDDKLHAPEPGVSSQVVDFVLVPGGPTLGFAQVAELGAAHGVQAVVSPVGAAEETEWKEWTEDRSAVRIVNGQSITDRWQVRCARRSARLQYGFTLYDATDGTERAKDTQGFTVSDSDCDERGDDPLAVASVDALYSANVASMGRAVASHFVPYWADVKLQTQRDAATRATLEIADGGQWDRFLDASVQVLVDDPYNPIALLHVGSGLEALGAVHEADLIFRYANRVKETPVTRAALSGIAERISQRRVLQEAYGITSTWTPGPAVKAWLEVAEKALSAVVKGSPASVKGEKNKRVPLLSAPGGDVIVQVPGGTELRVVATEGELVHVQLPDGVEGWMSAKMVRS
jgi:hypothetical protein